MEIEFVPAFVFGDQPNHFQEIAGGYSLFDFSYIEPFLVSECNVRPRLNLKGTAQLQVENLLNEILDEVSQKQDSYLLAVKADLLRLLVIVGRIFHESMKDKPEMQLFNHHRDAMLQTLDFIDKHFDEAISIEDAARHALLTISLTSPLASS